MFTNIFVLFHILYDDTAYTLTSPIVNDEESDIMFTWNPCYF